MVGEAFPSVTVEGAPLERGRQHGAQARERIVCSIETHRRAIRHYAGLEWTAAQERAASYLPVLQAYVPEMVAELHGIAEGAGLPFAEVLTLNVRYELTFTPRLAAGCTSFAVLPEASADGHTYLGQSWDNLAGLVDACIVLRVKRGGRGDYVTITEAGVPAMVGLNAAGIAVARNALVTPRAGETPGVPMNAVHYRILQAETVGDAVGAVAAAQLASPLCYVIGAPGDAIALEAAPPDLDFIHDEGGILTHANHFVSSRLHVTDLGKVALPDSLFRARRLRRFLEVRRGALDVAAIFEGMKDHFNYPDSICRHPDERDAADGRLATVFTTVMDLDAKVLYFSDGQPCQRAYRAVSL